VTPRRVGPFERLPQAVAEQVVRRIVELLDINEIVQRVDVNGVVQRVDVNAVMERVDIDAIVDRVDLDRLVEKLDVNAIVDRIDIDELVRKADLGPIIAQSTSGMLGEFLGFLRREVVGLDDLLDRLFRFRKRTAGRPAGPGQGPVEGPATERSREGQYAGGVTRLLAFAVDVLAIWGLYVLLAAGVEQAVRLFSGTTYTVESHRLVGIISVAVWGFLYFQVQWALSGRTIGMAILGARVVTTDGHQITRGEASVRTLVLPFAVVLWFVGLIEIVVRADRRALHDLAAGTCVVYHWQARGASLPWLHRDD
jgi:uncharacterized RDD family membrane protein YckC